MLRIRPERIFLLIAALLLVATHGAFAAFMVSGHNVWETAALWLALATLVFMLAPLTGFLLLSLWERFRGHGNP